MSYLSLFCRCLLALVFLAAVAGKLRSAGAYGAYVESLRTMAVLPAHVTGPVAAAVAAVELAVPLLLALPQLAVAGLALAGLLLIGFAVAITAVLRRGVRATCRCFGASAASPFGRHHVVRNAVLATAAAAGAAASLVDATVSWPVAALSVPLAALCAAMVIRLDDLVALFGPVSPSR